MREILELSEVKIENMPKNWTIWKFVKISKTRINIPEKFGESKRNLTYEYKKYVREMEEK